MDHVVQYPRLSIVFDIETTPKPKDKRLWPEKIHCIVLWPVGTGLVYPQAFVAQDEGDLEKAVAWLMKADRLIGHDIARFDLPVLRHFFPKFREWHGQVFDTLAASRMSHIATLEERSREFRERADPAEREKTMPADLVRKHKLEAWGYRLRIPKRYADVDESFYETYSEELLHRCVSDVKLTRALYDFLLSRGAKDGWPVSSELSVLVESEVSGILGEMERNGVGFDRAGAVELYAKLVEERERLILSLREQVPAWDVVEIVTPGRTQTKRKNVPYPTKVEKGSPYGRRIVIEFNPASPQHRVKVLKEQYGWEPVKKTKSGASWMTDEDTLRDLPYPIIPDLIAYMTVCKRLGQISEGKSAWLNCETQGRIHGAVHATGTRTSRGAHFSPNLGQVPRVNSLYGPECRALFRPTRPGWVQVGVDAKGLELRLLGHRLHPFDKGAFVAQVLDRDVHTEWMKITGLLSRDHQKEFIYGYLYGAGSVRLGLMYLNDLYKAGLWSAEGRSWYAIVKEARKHGERLKKKLRERVEGLDQLLVECSKSVNNRGWWRGLDGRILCHHSEHGALNDVLQSDGAVVMKYAMVIANGVLTNTLGPPGENWALMLWVHDEIQYECPREHALPLSLVVAQSIEEAGKKLEVRCPMEGDVKIGLNWGETH